MLEVTNITLDMIFALGIKEFSCVSIQSNKVEQIKLDNNKLYFWDTDGEDWNSFYIREKHVKSNRGFLENNYFPHSIFTWEIVNNEV